MHHNEVHSVQMYWVMLTLVKWWLLGFFKHYCFSFVVSKYCGVDTLQLCRCLVSPKLCPLMYLSFLKSKYCGVLVVYFLIFLWFLMVIYRKGCLFPTYLFSYLLTSTFKLLSCIPIVSLCILLFRLFQIWPLKVLSVLFLYVS